MTQLIEALQVLHLEAEVSLGARWAKLRGERCWVYVATAKDGGYFTWCDDPRERAIAFYRVPIEAIQTGLRRAAKPDTEKHTN